ncbi:hypothetical protein PCC9214_00242 [Planktothrix tepida]|uniref:Filament integrity protein n=2 Tax=Planktothrix TaxID=54304 RepID=A0A1J1LDN7_9CYAN|nr:MULTISPECIES: filament integrity protein FraC [Planktothrix]CAD5914279.1 hypothetical protein PCC9214_00242 [Planktothrix tepida]CAD5986209.1 hypothetical protein NO713_05575 [Planktothrix pseudagardhii]CUR30544.1 conserved membrane hypothetical protein [Planktothrix tepida PCC 9214]
MPILIALRVILLRIIRLLASIMIEAWIFKKSFNLSPKVSVQYAMVLNLLANACEWVVFLNAETLLPPEARKELIYYLLIEKIQETSPSIFLLTTFNFTLILFIKWIGFESLKVALSGDISKITKAFQENSEGNIKMSEEYRDFRIILIAHALSYSLFLGLAFTLLILE